MGKKKHSPPQVRSAREPTVDRVNDNGSWQRLCGSLLNEREQLLSKIASLVNENDNLKKSLGSLLREDIPIDKASLLAEFGREPSLPALVARFETAEK